MWIDIEILKENINRLNSGIYKIDDISWPCTFYSCHPSLVQHLKIKIIHHINILTKGKQSMIISVHEEKAFDNNQHLLLINILCKIELYEDFLILCSTSMKNWYLTSYLMMTHWILFS